MHSPTRTEFRWRLKRLLPIAATICIRNSSAHLKRHASATWRQRLAVASDAAQHSYSAHAGFAQSSSIPPSGRARRQTGGRPEVAAAQSTKPEDTMRNAVFT